VDQGFEVILLVLFLILKEEKNWKVETNWAYASFLDYTYARQDGNFGRFKTDILCLRGGIGMERLLNPGIGFGFSLASVVIGKKMGAVGLINPRLSIVLPLTNKKEFKTYIDTIKNTKEIDYYYPLVLELYGETPFPLLSQFTLLFFSLGQATSSYYILGTSLDFSPFGILIISVDAGRYYIEYFEHDVTKSEGDYYLGISLKIGLRLLVKRIKSFYAD